MVCQTCNGTGLLPFKNKEGKIIPHAFLNCSCKKDELEHYYPIKPEDFDFPMNETFRAWTYQHCGVSDPGYVPLKPEVPAPQVIEYRHSDMSKKDFARLQNLEGQVKYLQSKLTESEKRKQDYY